VQDSAHSWDREEAERRIGEVLDAARGGSAQIIRDRDGLFELVFKPSMKEPVGKFLARGGPIDR
jgi:hypothetical protein